jgi:hypothetical protein
METAASGTVPADFMTRGHKTMAAQQPEAPGVDGVQSLEVRWIFPGRLETTMTEWFGRFPAVLESREDCYLRDPRLRGPSVKIRGGRALEVKVYRGSPGVLDVPGRARGRMESWQKWSFPVARPGQGHAAPAGWTLVRKRRRIIRFPPAGGRGQAGPPGPGAKRGCGVELTEIGVDSEAWWSLGFEAAGPASVGLLRRDLEAAAALVFARELPAARELGPDDSMSYAEWLGGQLRAGSNADA